MWNVILYDSGSKTNKNGTRMLEISKKGRVNNDLIMLEYNVEKSAAEPRQKEISISGNRGRNPSRHSIFMAVVLKRKADNRTARKEKHKSRGCETEF